MTQAVATILRLALVTGQRIGEIAGMTQAEVDLSVANPCGRRQARGGIRWPSGSSALSYARFERLKGKRALDVDFPAELRQALNL